MEEAMAATVAVEAMVVVAAMAAMEVMADVVSAAADTAVPLM